MKLQSAVLVCILRLEAITCFSIYEHAHHKSSHGKSNPHRGIEKFFNSAKSIQKPPGYEKILKRARKLDEHPQEMEETGDRNMAPSGRGFTTDTTRRWKNQMLITLDPAFTPEQEASIKAGIYKLNEVMKCFDFKIYTRGTLPNDVDHLHIKAKDDKLGSCVSNIGRIGGKQITVISDRCRNFYGVTMHEIMHVLGFQHEHIRKDKGNYVYVNRSAMPSNAKLYQYGIVSDQQNLVAEYDFESIMHYPLNELMINIVPIPEGVIVGQRSHLSDKDVERLNKAYPCHS